MLLALFVIACAGSPSAARAAEYYYVDWRQADVAQGTASGVITLPDGSTVQVGFMAVNPDGSHGNLYDAQTDGGTNFWNPDTPYLSAQVSNAPPDTDLLQLAGGQNQIYKVTLSEAIKDPIMAIVSLGQASVPTTYDFDSPFTIVSQGAGYWGGTETSLVALPNNVLSGSEGHGTIQFIGTFAAFSWTVPTPESWHGFTFAIRTTERIEPTLDAGAADAGTPDAAADAGAATDAEADATETDAAQTDAELNDAGQTDAGQTPEDGDEAGTDDAGAQTDDASDETTPESDDPMEDAGLEVATSAVHTDIEDHRDGGCACSTAASWPRPDAVLPFALLGFAGMLRRRRRA